MWSEARDTRIRLLSAASGKVYVAEVSRQHQPENRCSFTLGGGINRMLNHVRAPSESERFRSVPEGSSTYMTQHRPATLAEPTTGSLLIVTGDDAQSAGFCKQTYTIVHVHAAATDTGIPLQMHRKPQINSKPERCNVPFSLSVTPRPPPSPTHLSTPPHPSIHGQHSSFTLLSTSTQSRTNTTKMQHRQFSPTLHPLSPNSAP